ncbi:MAG: PDZ domain-containing protein [bacterium]
MARVIWGIWGLLIVQGATVQAMQIERSVVRITNYQQAPDWQEPWRMSPTASSTGSGFLIENRWILTNAHVVSNSRMLLVNKFSTPEPFIAAVVAVAHDSDLALLQIDDPKFYQDLELLRLGTGLPPLQSRVRAYGYPQGGQDLSRTEGVVSRIEFGTYVHPGVDSHLLVQTDTAINPGNSGGPVMAEEVVMGVAFQSNLRLNDVGYFIPMPVVQRFLEDMRDGRYDGVPEIGVQTSSLLNPHLRDFLGLPEGRGGVIVEHVMPNSSADGWLRPGDVLLRVGERDLDLAGMVQYGGQVVDFYIEAEGRQVGDPLSFSIWREGQEQHLTLRLEPPPFSEEMRNSYDRLPEYLIYGGLVFVALSRNYVQTQGFSPILAYEHWFRESEQPGTKREQTVVISSVLPAAFNSGYTGHQNFVVDRVNGVRVSSLRHLDQLLSTLEDSVRFVSLESEWDPTPVILDRQTVERGEADLLERYGIREAKRLSRRAP